MSRPEPTASRPTGALAAAPTEREILTGVIVGEDPAAPPLPEVPPDLDPVTALEDAIRPHLQRPPCVVAFSGGRDSSAVLAVAVHLARREGLPLPVPATKVYPDVPSTEEGEWQDLVLRHLGVRERVRHEIRGELDLVGPIAAPLLRRFGPYWPPNAHSMVPLAEDARGGAILTGLEGDGLFGGWRWAAAAHGAGGRGVRPALRGAYARAPAVVRTAVAYRRESLPGEWLRPAARRVARWAYAAERTAQPRRWDERVAWWRRRRYLLLATAAIHACGETHGVEIAHPLLDPRFLAALAAAGEQRAFRDRTAVMRHLFADHLPEAALSRRGKAIFTDAFFGEASRAFARAWDGEGVDRSVVDVGALRRVWAAPSPDFRTAGLLQAAWLRSGDDSWRAAGEIG